MRGRGIRDGKEREWGGGTCSYNFDSLFPVPCLSLVPGEGTTLTKNGRETKATALEKDGGRARARKRKKERRKYTEEEGEEERKEI